jgi:tetratricopeptide (TPR) repeat protein
VSVINRMLHDLDARAAAALPAPPETPAGIPTAPRWTPRRDNPRWRMATILLVGGSAVAAVALADLSPFVSTPRMAAHQGDAAAEPAGGAPDAADAADVVPAVPTAGTPPQPGTPPPRQAGATPATQNTRPGPPPAAQPVPEPQLATPLPPLITKRSVAPAAEQLAAAALREAMELARAGQRQAALQRAQEALALAPAQGAARQLAAVLQHESGDTAGALALLREGAQMPAPAPALTLLLARLLGAQGLADEALEVLRRHDLRSAEAEGLRGGLLAQQGHYDQALPAYESAVHQQPGHAMWWFGLAVALDSQGQGERARQAFAQARGLGLPREDLLTYTEQRLRALN